MPRKPPTDSTAYGCLPSELMRRSSILPMGFVDDAAANDLGRAVNAGEKMHQRAGVKLHHGWMPNARTGGLWLRNKQDERCMASAANVPETWSVAEPSVLPVAARKPIGEIQYD